MNEQTRKAYRRLLGLDSIPDAVAQVHANYQELWFRLHGSSKVLPDTMLPTVVMLADMADSIIEVATEKPVSAKPLNGKGKVNKGG